MCDKFSKSQSEKIQEREIIKRIVCPRQFLFDKDKLCLLGFCGSKQFILITENVYFKKFKFSWCPFSLVEILTDRNLIGRDNHLFTWRQQMFLSCCCGMFGFLWTLIFCVKSFEQFWFKNFWKIKLWPKHRGENYCNIWRAKENTRKYGQNNFPR